ncbi:MAG: hypothetical protein FWD96_06115 [Defluviitaleaceae bacterium]|nr:hypothetical protein [Defluviitaleaceae bacterium]
MEFFKTHRKIILPAIAAVAAVAIGLAVFNSPAVATPISVYRALTNLGGEATQRVEGSPVQALWMMADILQDGRVVINFEQSDTSGGFGMFSGVRGALALDSDTAAGSYALAADVTVGGFFNFDFAAYADRERVAMRSRFLDTNFYGFRYDTFRQDVRNFGGIIGLSEAEMDELASMAEAFGVFMNEDHSGVHALSNVYIGLLRDFFFNLEYTSQQQLENEASSGEMFSVTRIEYSIAAADIVVLLNDMYAALEADDTLRATLELAVDPIAQGTGVADASDFDTLLQDVRAVVDAFESGVNGSMILALYIDDDNRLARAEIIAADMHYGLGHTSSTTVFNFGRTVFDTWGILHTATGNGGDWLEIRLDWGFIDGSDGFINTVNVGSSYGVVVGTFESLWNPESGDFTLSVRDDGWLDASITGNFVVDGEGFSLSLDDPGFIPGQNIDINITAYTGADIEPIEFVNLDQWDQSLLDTLEMIMSLIP